MVRPRWVPRHPKYDYQKFYTRFIVVIFLVVIISTIVAHILTPTHEEIPGERVINGLHCKVPEYAFTQVKDLKILRAKLPKCDSKSFLTSIISSLNASEPIHLKLNEDFIKSYGVKKVDCCYRTIRRIHGTDDRVQFSDSCVPFTGEHELNKNTEHIFVECNSNGQEVYSNAHAIITNRPKYEQRIKSSGIKAKKPYKVMMLGFDSFSRKNFRRGLPMSQNYVHGKTEWFEMKGYTRIGNETFSNLFAALTGQSPKQKYKMCNPTEKTFLDDCQFVWGDFKKAGYITVFAEDQLTRSAFNVRHLGFQNQPTDHYFRPFVLAAEQTLDTKKLNDLVFCLGKSVYTDHIFVYALKMVQIHETQPYFGVFYVNSLSNKQLSSSVVLDKKIAKSFVKVIEEKNDNDMIMIYFGDTGTRFEEMPVKGFYEERNPVLWIRLPLRFQKEHPEFADNLRINSNRLTTPYDLYITLRHIINLSADKSHDLSAIGCDNCQSMFIEISIGRSCSDVNIPYDSCPCSLMQLDVHIEVVQLATKHALEVLNQKLMKLKTSPKKKTETPEPCMMLKLKEITSAHQQLASIWDMNYIISFTVTPSKAHFEAILRKRLVTVVSHLPQFDLVQEISHINQGREPVVCVGISAATKRRISEGEVVDNESSFDDDSQNEILDDEEYQEYLKNYKLADLESYFIH